MYYCENRPEDLRELMMKRQLVVGYMWVKLTLDVHKHSGILGGVVVWHSNMSAESYMVNRVMIKSLKTLHMML